MEVIFMKTSLSRLIVNFFSTTIFYKKLSLSFTLFALIISSISLLCMETDANALLGELEQTANALGPGGATLVKGAKIVATTAVAASKIDLVATQEAIKTAFDTVSKPVSTNPHGNSSHSLEVSVAPIKTKDDNPVLDQAANALTTTIPAQEKPKEKTTEVAQTKADKSEDVVEKSTTTQEQQAEVQTQDSAVAQAAEAAQLKEIGRASCRERV
mgnify:FL=1